MRKTVTLVFLSLLGVTFLLAQVHIGAKFTPKLTTIKPDSAYFGDIGIRGSWVAPDLDKDGKPEIFVTDYTKTGRVHAFQAVGNDTLEWIWSSPRLDTLTGLPYGAGGASTPRTIRHGDMDGDGKGEIIFPRGGSTGGFLIFEWNGVNGSHKFGTKPSAFIPANVPYGPNFGGLAGTPNEGGLQLTVEQFEVMDVDGDGVQELVTPKNLSGTVNDDFLVISAVGQWEFEDQGFASFQIEGSAGRQASVKFGGGSPYAIHPADLNGDGKLELVCHNWQELDYWVIKVTGADTYVLPDTTGGTSRGNQYFNITPGLDYVALFGGIVADLDKDNNQEVYLPLYSSLDPQYDGSLFVINYKPGDDVQKADSSHVGRAMAAVSQSTTGAPISSFTGVVADLDGNGKQEILIGSSYPSNVVGVEYNGSGSIQDAANYTRKVYYTGESTTYGTVTYRDSAGVKDTTTTIGEGFVSKMSKPIDIDGDGRLEIILPYQSLIDSVTYTWKSWKDTAFVTDSTKKVTNPKKWSFRSLERDAIGSVNPHDMVVITPDDYILNQNYPNPFNPSTTISFVLPLQKKVTAKIYDMLGKEVRTLINNEEYAKGTHQVVWNGRDNNGRQVASGTYIFKMTAGNVEKAMKMMMLK